MSQRLITGNDRNEWQDAVNRLLKDGWQVIPGTMAISGASPMEVNSPTYSCKEPRFQYAIVLESTI
jgi:hypothetical protein